MRGRGARTNDKTKRLVLSDALASSQKLEQINVLFHLLATDALPTDFGTEVLCQIALLEDVVGEVGELGVGGATGGVQGLELDALVYDGRRGGGTGVVVAEPGGGWEVRWMPHQLWCLWKGSESGTYR